MAKGEFERIQGVIVRDLKNGGGLQRAERICGLICGEGVDETRDVVAEDGSVIFSVAKLQSLNTNSI